MIKPPVPVGVPSYPPHMPRKAAAEAGSIRKRGERYQVRVRAGLDPVTGKELVLTASAGTMDEAKEIRRRMLVQVDEQRHDKTKATCRAAMEKWLRIHEVDDSTRQSYEVYARQHLYRSSGICLWAGSRLRC